MPEEKYGDIDVNPIETRIDTKIDSTKYSELSSDSNFAQAIEAASELISEQPESDDVVSETVVVEDVVEPTSSMSTIPEEETSIDLSVSAPEDSADEPTSVSAPEDSTDESTSISMPTPETPKSKKKKLPLIVFGATLVTLVVGGSAFAFYYNMPEKVAADAISGFIKQSSEKLASSGNLELSPQTDSELYQHISNLRLDFKTDVDHFNRSAEFDFGIRLREYGYLHFKLSTFLEENGTAYLNIDNLTEAYQKAVKAAGLKQDDPELRLTLSLLEKSLKNVEGKWWRIDVNEVMSSLDKTDFKLEKNDKENISSAYACLVNEIKQELSQTDRLAKSYLEHPFINLTSVSYDKLPEDSLKGKIEDYGNLYQVSVDADKLFDFTKKHQQAAENTKIVECLKKIEKSSGAFDEDDKTGDTEDQELTKADVQNFVSHLKNLYLGIDFLTHQLKGAYLQVSESKVDFTGIVNFKYQNSAPVVAPRDATSAGDIIKGLFSNQGVVDGNTNLEEELKEILRSKKFEQEHPDLD